MKKETVELELRLGAIEYLLTNLYVKHFQLIQAPKEAIVKANRDVVAEIDAQTNPDLPAVWSDMFSQEFADEVRRLLDMVEEMMGIERPGKKPPPATSA